MTRLLRKHSLSRSACLSEAVHRISLRTSGKQSSTLLKLSTEREKSRQVDKAVTEATRFPLVNRQISEKRNVAKHQTKDKRIIIIDNVQLRKKEKIKTTEPQGSVTLVSLWRNIIWKKGNCCTGLKKPGAQTTDTKEHTLMGWVCLCHIMLPLNAWGKLHYY